MRSEFRRVRGCRKRNMPHEQPLLGIKMKYLFLSTALAGSLAIGQTAPRHNPTTRDRMKTIYALHEGANYMLALKTADRFLTAWMSDGFDVAESLLDDRLKSDLDGDFESFMSSPCPCAYEINHGKKVRPGSYEFPVVLFRPPAGNSRISVQNSVIVVSKTSADRWVIEKLP